MIGTLFAGFTTNITTIISAKYSTVLISNVNFTNCNMYGSLLNTVNSNLTVSLMGVANSVFYKNALFFNDFDGILFPSTFLIMGVGFQNNAQNVTTSGGMFLHASPGNYSYTNYTVVQCQFSKISSSIITFNLKNIYFIYRNEINHLIIFLFSKPFFINKRTT